MWVTDWVTLSIVSVKMKYLIQRESGTYYYRRRVPNDIRSLFSNPFIKKSLKTKDFAKAKQRWKIVDTDTDYLFQRMRHQKQRKLSDKALQAVADNHAAGVLARDEEARVGGYGGLSDFDRFPFLEHDQAFTASPMDAVVQQAATAHFAIEELRTALALDNYEDISPDVEGRILEQLKEAGYTGAPSAKIYRMFVEAELKAQEGILTRCEGQSVPTPVIVPVGGQMLSVEAEKWADDKKKLGEWRDKTANMFLAAVRLFIGVAGDREISEYGKDDARHFKSTLLKLPANVWKHGDMTIDEILKLDLPPMSANNARKIFFFVGSFFRYAVESYDVMTANPFQGQSIRKKKNEDSRHPFTPEDLDKIFNAPVYHGVQSSRFWSKPGSFSMRKTGKFWIPLIGLFTGMRLGEIVQLHAGDIKHKDGFLIFDVCRGEDKDFKTETAVRQIPVHHELVRCGLLQHVEQCSGIRLFPEIKRAKADGTYSYTFSKHFNGRFLPYVGVKRDGIVFHSFRHSFEDACLNTGMQDSMVDMLQGHKLEGMKSVYASRIDLKLKNEFVQKIEYEGLDLSHLHVE